jgi:hypothetical protein
VDAHYDFSNDGTDAECTPLDNLGVHDVSYWLVQLRDLHTLAINGAATAGNEGLLADTLMESLICCILCMQQNGIVQRGLAPVVERVLSRGTTELNRVFVEIDAERDYQDNLPSSRTDGSEKDVYGYLVMYDSYMRKAIDAWTENAGPFYALDIVRKLAGILVHCFEDLD